jgi:thioredoxin-related protein
MRSLRKKDVPSESLFQHKKKLMSGGNVTKFLMFTKESCGPCGLVKRYISALKDPRESVIEEVYLEDVSDEPIPEDNLKLAKKYGVTATPVLVIADKNGELLETYVGGLPITQNIRKLWTKYDV